MNTYTETIPANYEILRAAMKATAAALYAFDEDDESAEKQKARRAHAIACREVHAVEAVLAREKAKNLAASAEYSILTAQVEFAPEILLAIKACVEEARCLAIEAEKRVPPVGYVLLSLKSNYYGSHSEYGEGDYSMQVAVPEAWQQVPIELSHGHHSSHSEELAKLPAETLFADECDGGVRWKYFFEDEAVRNGQKPFCVESLNWYDPVDLKVDWYVGGRRVLSAHRNEDDSNVRKIGQYIYSGKLLRDATQYGFTEEELHAVLRSVNVLRDGQLSTQDLLPELIRPQ